MPDQLDFNTAPDVPEMTPRRSPPTILVALVLGLVLFALALAGYAFLNESGVPSDPEPPLIEELNPSEEGLRESSPIEEPEGVFCTLDAKLCPDGTSVGRVAPSCEFAPCPGE